MIFWNRLLVWFLPQVCLIVAGNIVSINENDAVEFLKGLNKESAEAASKLASAQWEFEKNNTESAEKKLFQITAEAVTNTKLRFQKVVSRYPWRSFSNSDVRRQLKLYSEIGIFALPTNEFQQFQKIMYDLDVVQLNTTICDYYNKTKCNLRLNPDIKEKLVTSQNAAELSHLWKEWRKASEPELKNLLNSYVKLCNNAAVLNNYTSFQDYSLRNFEIRDLGKEMTELWEMIRPMYYQIHAYVRRKLRGIYGVETVSLRGPIPSHLLGNIWLENWSGIAHRMVPFPQQDNINFTSIMLNQGYSAKSIHQLAENFFVSMNFSIPYSVWFNHTSNEKKTSDKSCHPKIFNFYNEKIWIKDCDRVSLQDYLTANRLLAQTEYMLQYSHQPFIYQSPADPGLEEAIKNVVSMSATTFTNLKKIKLYKEEISEEVRINRLFKLAMEKITPIPFLLVQEFWRWEIYKGKPIDETVQVLNKLREKFQGVSAFVNELSFDPGGEGSIFSTLSLTHRFLGYFLEFQIYESLCRKSKTFSNDIKVLDECSLYENVKAGKALRDVMSLGSSKPLMETLLSFLGCNKINSQSVIKYFEPLMNWLKKDNKLAGEFIGWEESNHLRNSKPKKKRRKRSLEDYPSECSEDDTDKTSSREPDRFQRLVFKRSKEKTDDSKMSERDRKSTESEEGNKEKVSGNSKDNSVKGDKERRNVDKTDDMLTYSKKRGSFTKNEKKNNEEPLEQNTKEVKENADVQKLNNFLPRSKKRHSGSEPKEQEHEHYTKTRGKNLNNFDNTHQKRSSYETNNNNENTAKDSNVDVNGVGGSNNNKKGRYERRAKKIQRQTDSKGADSQVYQKWSRNDENQYERERSSRNAKWHTNSKKDISRLLHSFGLNVENDEKEKIKELRKKLKGDSNVEFKSKLATNDNSYETLGDFSRIKSDDDAFGDDKRANKLWSIKSFMVNNAILQSNPVVDNKESLSNAHMTSSVLSHGTEEKNVGKKETSSNIDPSLTQTKDRGIEAIESQIHQNTESFFRNLDLPSLQAFLKNNDLSVSNQKSGYAKASEGNENKIKIDLSQLLGLKSAASKFTPYTYKFGSTPDASQFKDKKEFKEDLEAANKAPYIIILGQLSPEARERLMQDKAVSFAKIDKPQLQSRLTMDDKKTAGKKTRAAEQVYIIPIDLKNFRQNLLKTNHHTAQEVGLNSNAEHDQDSKEQLHREDSPKQVDENNFFKIEKDAPSEFIISWNNNKNRKIVKRSKRDREKGMEEDKLKGLRISPMKESILEGLLGKSIDRANSDDKNSNIMLQDNKQNGGSDSQDSFSGDLPSDTSNMVDSSILDSPQSSAGRSSSFSSLASSVLSALSPKSYSQLDKAPNPHQNIEMEEDSLKENNDDPGVGLKDQKEQSSPYVANSNLRCNSATAAGKKKGSKFYSDDELRKGIEEAAATSKGDETCRKIILSPCPPPKCPCLCPCPSPCPPPPPPPCPCPPNLPPPCPCPCPLPCPCPSPCPSTESKPCDNPCKQEQNCKQDPPEVNCKKPSECSLVNCQFKITKAKKPHERLTIMIYDRINPPAELPEPYDALAVISEILQRIQCCSNKPNCQLTEEDPDYPANDNSDQLKGNQPQENKNKIQELSGEIPILGNDNQEDDETDENSISSQNSPNSVDENKIQPKEKATPAIDQLTVFNKDKLKPVFIELRKIDDLINKRSHQE